MFLSSSMFTQWLLFDNPYLQFTYVSAGLLLALLLPIGYASFDTLLRPPKSNISTLAVSS